MIANYKHPEMLFTVNMNILKCFMLLYCLDKHTVLEQFMKKVIIVNYKHIRGLANIKNWNK